MKKLFSLVVLLAAFAATAYAADAKETSGEKLPHVQGFVSNTFADNWEISLGIGPNFLCKTGSKGFGNIVGVGAYVSANKWFHPVFGARLAIEAGQFNYIGGQYGQFETGDKVKPVFLFGHIDVMANLSNWIAGYNGKSHLYDAILMVGAGVAANDLAGTYKEGWPKIQKKNGKDGARMPHEYAFNFGWQNRFNVCKSLSVDLTLNYMLSRKGLAPGGIYGQRVSSRWNALNVYAGITYRFNRRDYDRSGATIKEYEVLVDRLTRIEKQMADAQAENTRLQQVAAEQANALAAAQALAAEREAALKAAQEKVLLLIEHDTENELLFYLCGRSVLTNNNKLRLNRFAEKIFNSENKEHVYSIFGFADAETGSHQGNLKLAEKRAKVVYDYLVAQGVPAERLQYKGCGVDAAPINKLVSEQNRTVVIY